MSTFPKRGKYTYAAAACVLCVGTLAATPAWAQTQIQLQTTGSLTISGPAVVSEGSSARFVITRHVQPTTGNVTFSPGTSPTTVDLAINSTALPVIRVYWRIERSGNSEADENDLGDVTVVGSDAEDSYSSRTITSLPATNSVVMRPGQAERTFDVSVVADGLPEQGETFRAAFYRGSGGSIWVSSETSPLHVDYAVVVSSVTVTINPEPPPPPDNLRATSTEPGKVTVSWNADDVARRFTANYQYGRVAAGGSSASISWNTIADGNSATTSYTFSGLMGGTAYDFYIRGVNERGAEGAATFVSATVESQDYDRDDDNLIDVATAAQLRAIRHDPDGNGTPSDAGDDEYYEAFPGATSRTGCAGACTGYELSEDIDLSGMDWTPIGAYSAIFEGNGRVIKGLRIRGGTQIGLVRTLTLRGRIRNVGLTNVDIRTDEENNFIGGVGALAGISQGKIAASYVIGGSVAGSMNVGGLVGGLMGPSAMVIACYADVPVSGISRVGGLIGQSPSAERLLRASYYLGNVTARPSVGNESVETGALMGFNVSLQDSGGPHPIQDSYYDRNRTTPNICCTTPLNNDEINHSKTTADLQFPTTASGIYAGWRRLNVDDVGGDDDDPWHFGSQLHYPVLRHGRDTTEIRANVLAQLRLQRATEVRLTGDESVPEDVGETTYQVRLPAGFADLDPGVTASWRWVVGGTGAYPAAPDDFDGPTSGVVTISAGSGSQSFGVAVKRDNYAERAEAFAVRLSSIATVTGVVGAGGDLPLSAPASMETTIEVESLSVTATPSVIREAGNSETTFVLSLGRAGGAAQKALFPVRVRYELSGTALGGGVDYAYPQGYAASSGTATIPMGGTYTSVVVAARADGVHEFDEKVVLELAEVVSGGEVAALGAVVNASVTIAADAPLRVRLSASTTSVMEADENLSFEVALLDADGNATKPREQVTFRYGLSGAATGGGVDYVHPNEYAAGSGTVTAPISRPTGTVVVALKDDDLNEADEDIVMTLLAVTTGNGAVRLDDATMASIVIEDDDPLTYAAHVDRTAIEEMPSTLAYSVYFLDNGKSEGDITVDYTVSGSATSGMDYQGLSSGSITVPAGKTTATVTVTVADDNINESTETIILTLGDMAERHEGAGVVSRTSAVSDQKVQTTIAANDEIVAEITNLSVKQLDAGERFVITVGLGGVVNESPIEVRYTVTGAVVTGAAQPARQDDFRDETNGRIEIMAGATNGDIRIVTSQVFAVPRGIRVTLEQVTGAAGAARVGATATADLVSPYYLQHDMDVRYEGAAMLPEGSSAVFTVGLTGDAPAAGAPVTVDWALGGVEASDIAGALTGSLSFASAQTQSVVVRLAEDGVIEADETLVLTLRNERSSNPRSAVDVNPSSASVSIRSKENAVVKVVALTPSVAEISTEPAFRIWLDRGDGNPIAAEAGAVISWTVSMQSSAGDQDYFLTPASRARIPPGSTATVVQITTLKDSLLREGTESVVIRLAGVDALGALDSSGNPALALADDDIEARVIIEDDTALRVEVRVLLQGAYDPAPGELKMRTTLIDNLPSSQPYGVQPWNYTEPTTLPRVDGGVGLSGVTSTIVDWVLLELRAVPMGSNAEAAASTSPSARAAGLLLHDGRVAGVIPGAPSLAESINERWVNLDTDVDDASKQDWYVVVHHRNHLSVMSANALTAAGDGCAADYCVDLTESQSYRQGQSLLGGSLYGMVAGDVNRDGMISYADSLLIRLHNLTPLRPVDYDDADGSGNYAVDADLDFDGEVLSKDRFFVIENNRRRAFSLQ